MTHKIKVHLLLSPDQTGISFRYDPPPLLWIFHERTEDEFARELHEKLAPFAGQQNKEITRQHITHTVEQYINSWIHNGWIIIDPMYDIVNDGE
jgi:hypothetical protein